MPISKAIRIDTVIQLTHLDSLLIDTPKILKGGKDYFLVSNSKREVKYFGNKFAPYKLESYNLAQIERMLDSVIKHQQQNSVFMKKSIVDFNYEIYSAVTSNKNLETRVVGFDNNNKKVHINGTKLQENYSFYIVYDLIKQRILTFKTFKH